MKEVDGGRHHEMGAVKLAAVGMWGVLSLENDSVI